MVGGVACDLEILLCPRRFIQRHESIRHLGEVVGERHVTRWWCAVVMPAAVPRPVRTAKFRREELAEFDCGGEPAFVVQCEGRLGKGGEHHRVPLGDHLVVESRSWTLRSFHHQSSTRGFDVVRSVESSARMHPSRDRPSLEVAGLADPEPRAGVLAGISAEAVDHFARSPRVEESFVAVSSIVE